MVVKRKAIPSDYSNLGRTNWKEMDVEFLIGMILAMKEDDYKVWRTKLEKINRIIFDVKGKNSGATPIQRAAYFISKRNRKELQNRK